MTQIAAKVGLYKSTVHRILAALESRSFVRQEEVTGRYRLGLRALELAQAYLASGDLPTIALDEMQILRDLAEETVSLYLRDGAERVRVQRAEGPLTVRRVVGLGERLPLYIGASGKVLLAWCSERDRRQILDTQLPPEFERSSLEAELDQVRQQGWAMSQEEREDGVGSVAAPVIDRLGNCVGALAISGPVSRFEGARVATLSRAVQASARSIGLKL